MAIKHKQKYAFGKVSYLTWNIKSPSNGHYMSWVYNTLII